MHPEMLLVSCIVILSLWNIFFSFSLFSTLFFSLQEGILQAYWFLLSPFGLRQLLFPAGLFFFEIFLFFAQRLNTRL